MSGPARPNGSFAYHPIKLELRREQTPAWQRSLGPLITSSFNQYQWLLCRVPGPALCLPQYPSCAFGLGPGLEVAALYWSFVLGAGVLGPAARPTRPKGNDLREQGQNRITGRATGDHDALAVTCIPCSIPCGRRPELGSLKVGSTLIPPFSTGGLSLGTLCCTVVLLDCGEAWCTPSLRRSIPHPSLNDPVEAKSTLAGPSLR